MWLLIHTGLIPVHPKNYAHIFNFVVGIHSPIQCCPKTVAQSQNSTHKHNGWPIVACKVVSFVTNIFHKDFLLFHICMTLKQGLYRLLCTRRIILRSREVSELHVCVHRNTPIAVKYDWQLGSNAAKLPVKFQSISLNNLKHQSCVFLGTGWK